MDFELNKDQETFQRVVRDFCEAEIKPHAAEIDENSDLRWDKVKKMADIGLLSLQVPEDYDGAEEIGRAHV